MPQIQFPDFMAVTVGLVTYLLGEAINTRVGILRRMSIPDPVTGGLLVALLFYLLYEAGVVKVSFDTHARDLLLLVFFTASPCIGPISSRARPPGASTQGSPATIRA